MRRLINHLKPSKDLLTKKGLRKILGYNTRREKIVNRNQATMWAGLAMPHGNDTLLFWPYHTHKNRYDVRLDRKLFFKGMLEIWTDADSA